MPEAVAVDWHPHTTCPSCGAIEARIVRTMPTEPGDAARIRYHRCECGARFKSIEAVNAMLRGASLNTGSP